MTLSVGSGNSFTPNKGKFISCITCDHLLKDGRCDLVMFPDKYDCSRYVRRESE